VGGRRGAAGEINRGWQYDSRRVGSICTQLVSYLLHHITFSMRDTTVDPHRQ